ncbi:MAG TPA: hypothetical protein DDZ90_15485, partial [Planctomycetaceae bacterium]|nr:hypothetical protein [Planctomycetaceae bacterium]
QTKLLALEHIEPGSLPADLDWLQRQAIASRPELHAQLATLEKDRQALNLARLAYKPDVTLGATWIDVGSTGVSPVANGNDSFLITAGIT